jgi:DNA-binding response OmpR family regulator
MAHKVLVVDDTPNTLEMLAVFLRRSNYDVLTASSFEQARKVADQDTPDLIIVDVRLGEYNGLHLVIRERLAHPERPIIVISGYADEQTAEEVRHYGAEFMAKPVQPAELAATIARLLGPSPPAS